MHYCLGIVQAAIAALQVWSPMQLLLLAALTVVLGYVGIVGRVATR